MRTAALLLTATLTACGSNAVSSPTPVRMSGECMGTSWSAVVTLQPGEAYDDVVALIQAELDAVDAALSTWKELTAPRKVERTGIPASGV